MDQFPAYRKHIEQQIVDTVTEHLEKNKISTEDARQMSVFVLDHIDTITSHPQLIQFLRQMAQKWPIFGPVYEIERGFQQRAHESKAAKAMANLLRLGRVKNAISMAKTTMRGK